MRRLLSLEMRSMFTPRILVVDDETPLLESYREALTGLLGMTGAKN